ncbi:ABC transporter permease subunit [Bordetella sp. 15P40C-2]|nr:ABC transporter permease subunit [Bordetella sp. 15P40C-2]
MRQRLRLTEKRRQWLAFGLVAPLLLFLVVNFVVPIVLILKMSVDDRQFSRAAPGVVRALAGWDARTPIPEAAARAWIDDLRSAKGTPALNIIANRLNQDTSGYRSLVMSTARRLGAAQPDNAMKALTSISDKWGQPPVWQAIQRASGPLTSMYMLAAMDLHRTSEGGIAPVPNDEAVFVTVFQRTFGISIVVTLCCLVLGYPVAHLLASSRGRVASVMMLAVLIPFWTALLVRTSAWVVLLQRDGVVNYLLQWLGLIDHPLALVFNRTGTYIALVHVLLPFMILPIYSLMAGIRKHTVRAAISLGASPLTAFWRVYFPQTVPGVATGCLLVFVMAIGFYITPALIGGAGDQMIGFFIAHFITESANWAMGAALGGLLLIITCVVLVALSWTKTRQRVLQ